MHKSDTITALAAALAKAQGRVQPAIKDSINPHLRSKYANLASVWDACREALSSNGLSVLQMPTEADTGYVALTTILMHSSGEYISESFSTPLAKNDAQGIGSALTYLRRYALASFVGIVADEDDDGHAASQQPNSQPASYNKPAPKPAAHSAPAEPSEAEQRDQLIKSIKAIAPAAKALGVNFPTTAPKDMTLAELQGLYDICQAATNIDA